MWIFQFHEALWKFSHKLQISWRNGQIALNAGRAVIQNTPIKDNKLWTPNNWCLPRHMRSTLMAADFPFIPCTFYVFISDANFHAAIKLSLVRLHRLTNTGVNNSTSNLINFPEALTSILLAKWAFHTNSFTEQRIWHSTRKPLLSFTS